MKKLMLMALVLVLLSSSRGNACVGRILTIGVLPVAQEELLAQMVAILMTERTGTNVKIVQFKDSKSLYQAVKKGEVGVVIEKVGRGLSIVGISAEGVQSTSYETVKSSYRKSLNLVWLEPFGESQRYAPVVSLEVVANMPALPKLVSKLGGVLNSESYAGMVKNAASEGSSAKVVRRFLKTRKMI